MIVIKTSYEASYRVVLAILKAIREGNLYQSLEDMQKLCNQDKEKKE